MKIVMKPIFFFGSVILLIELSTAVPQQDGQYNGDINKLIKTVFGNGNNGQLPNEQVPSTASDDNLIKSVFNPSGLNTPTQTDSSSHVLNPSEINGTAAVVDDTRTKIVDNSDGCVCVPYYQCQNGTILENGVGLIDIRIQKACEDYLEVCCAPSSIADPPTTSQPAKRKGCGHRNPEGVGFRITGNAESDSQFAEFPWMVAVLKEDSVGNSTEKLNVYQCGGALIHPQVVLTAAHCINGKAPEILKIRAGEWDTQTKNEYRPHQDRQVRYAIIHEKFHPGALYYDFGLLVLSEPVQIDENVDVVCIPESDAVFDYSRCFASGWGKDIFGKEGHYQVILKRVELPVVPFETCQNSLRTTRLGRYFKLDKSFICAGGEPGRDTCKGDGGSPLVCPIKNDPRRYEQAGIVAWGIGCGENQIPGVYANVAKARLWIDQQMNNLNLDSREYQYKLY